MQNETATPGEQLTSSRAVGIGWTVAALIALALAVRLTAAWALPRLYPPRYSGAFYFPDSELYWKLGLQLYHGRPYTDGARLVVRTPGYPAFLAVAMRLVGAEPQRVRLAQAAAATVACLLFYLLWRRLFDERVARVGLALVAVYPPAVLLSVLLLSEGIFVLWLSAQLWALAELWAAIRTDRWDDPHGGQRVRVVTSAVAAGLTGALAALTRPVWLPVTPLAAGLLLWALARRRRRAGSRLHLADAAAALVVILAFVLLCFPWWARNRLLTGHWVLGSLWVGASLYDGLNPQATGASDMSFLDAPERYGLEPGLPAMGEYEQDLYLRQQAWEFVRRHPAQALWLAWRKQLRFWSVVPHAPGWSAAPLRWIAAALWCSVYAAILVGAWRSRPVSRWFLFLLGPLAYSACVHLLFVGSIRYREPVLLPALGLVAVAICSILGRKGQSYRKDRSSSDALVTD